MYNEVLFNLTAADIVVVLFVLMGIAVFYGNE